MVRVPVVDLAPARLGGRRDRVAVAREIDRACREIGFFSIVEHGIPAATVGDLQRLAHSFFSLGVAEKRAASHPLRTVNRGYRARGDETLAATERGEDDAPAPPDLKEFFHIGPVDLSDDPYYRSARGQRYFPENIWPKKPDGFEEAATVYYRSMHELIQFLMRLAALALGMEEDFFDRKVDRSIGTMRLNYYPAQIAAPLPDQLRAGAHRDYGGFTVLSGEDVPGGLQVQTRQGTWVDVATRPNEFVVNIGDLLMRWTNDRWLSNLHRVVNPPFGAGPGSPRLSMAFFNHPNYDVLIECLCEPGDAKHEPVISGDYRDALYAKIGLAPAPPE